MTILRWLRITTFLFLRIINLYDKICEKRFVSSYEALFAVQITSLKLDFYQQQPKLQYKN